MFRRVVIPVVVLAATLCPIPVIGDAAEPIQNLALQPGDMPAAARSQSPTLMTDAEELGALAPYGVREGASYWYSWLIDGTNQTSSDSIPREWQVSGEVYRASDESGAKRLFALSKGAGGMTRSHPDDETKILGLPRYGDEQFARVSKGDLPRFGDEQFVSLESLVLVRRATVVWEIKVKPSLPFEAIEAQLAETQLIAVLETYAAKQKARIDAR